MTRLTDHDLSMEAGSQLNALCQRILEVGELDLEKIKALRRLLRKHAGQPIPALAFLSTLMNRIVKDGVVNRRERNELLEAIAQVVPAACDDDEAAGRCCPECGAWLLVNACDLERDSCPNCQPRVAPPETIQNIDVPDSTRSKPSTAIKVSMLALLCCVAAAILMNGRLILGFLAYVFINFILIVGTFFLMVIGELVNSGIDPVSAFVGSAVLVGAILAVTYLWKRRK